MLLDLSQHDGAGEDGNIYGATTNGGLNGDGTIFVIAPAGALTDLHDFNGVDGMGPQGGISIGLEGNFYGTTYLGGGVNNDGAIFTITPSGTFISLYAFSRQILTARSRPHRRSRHS